MRRFLLHAGGVACGAITFVVAAVGAVFLHGGVPAERRLLAKEVNGALAGSFKGKLSIDAVGRLGLGSVDGVDASLYDPSGRRVVHVSGARVRVDLPALLSAVAHGKDEIPVTLAGGHIEKLEIDLEKDAGTGDLTLLDALSSAKPAGPPSSKHVALRVEGLEVKSARVFGGIVATPHLDADVASLRVDVLSSPERTSIDVAPFDVVARTPLGHPPDLRARVQASFATPSQNGLGFDARLVVDGHLGDLAATVDATVAGDQVDAVVDVPQTSPSVIASLVPGAPLGQSVSAHVEAHGDLGELRTTGTVKIGAGIVALSGVLAVSDEPRANLDVKVTDLEPRAFQASAPDGRVSAELSVKASMTQDAGLEGTYTLVTQPTTLAGQSVPQTSTKGQFDGTGAVDGATTLDEPGVTAAASFALHDPGTGEVVDFDARVSAPELARVPRITGSHVSGSAKVEVKGALALAAGTVDATVLGLATNLSRGDLHADRATLEGRVRGPLANPTVDLVVVGDGLTVSGRKIAHLRATASGPARSPAVTATIDAPGLPHVDATASLDLSGGVDVHGALVEIERDGVEMRVSAANVHAGGGQVTVDDAVVDGLGQPLALTASFGSETTTVHAHGEDIDLRRLAKLAGGLLPVTSGRVAVDVDLVTRGGTADGHVKLDAKHVAAFGLEGAGARVALVFAGKDVTGHASAELGDAGTLNVELSKLALGGSLLSPASWTRATFDATVNSEIDLAKLAALLPNRGALPFGKVAGVVALSATLSRPNEKAAPTATVEVSTKGLDLAGKPVQAPAFAWEISGADVAVTAHADGGSGATEVDARVFDSQGDLVRIAVESTLPLRALADAPAAAKELLEKQPFVLHLESPRRALETLPAFMRPPQIRGDASMALEVTGTELAPHATLHVSGANLESTDPRAAAPLDVALGATYDGTTAETRVELMRPDRGVVVDARATLAATLDDLRRAGSGSGGGAVPWHADSDVVLTGFPLGAFPMIAHRQIQGDVSGEVKLTGLHEDARLDARLTVAGLSLGGVPFQKASVVASAARGSAQGTAEIDDPAGSIRADGQEGIVWGAALLPAGDDSRPRLVSLTAKNFRARALMPFVEGAVNDLDGMLNANAKIRIDPGFATGDMQGSVALTGGRLEVPSIGQELHGVTATLTMKPWGTLNIDKISADALTGHVDAWARAKFAALAFRSAEAHATIAKGEEIPVTLEGVPLGQASGNVDVFAELAKDGKTINVTAKVPTLTADLPQATGHSVQGTDDDAHITVGTIDAQSRFASLPLHAPQAPRSPTATHLHVEADLGDILVKRDPDLRITLTGKPIAEVGQKTQVTGKIVLKTGMVNLYGKKFELDEGVVTFTGGDPSNPQLLVTAHYDAPDGTRVYADVTGAVKTIKVTLRSEPAHTQNEILSLVLFGSIEGETGSPPPDQQEDAESAAAGVAGGLLAQGVDKLLSGVTPFEIATKLDTSDAQDPRPSVDVQVSQDVLLDVSYSLGIPPPGDNPDRMLVTVDWHFFRSWSLLATVGDQGSSILDLLWQHRY